MGKKRQCPLDVDQTYEHPIWYIMLLFNRQQKLERWICYTWRVGGWGVQTETCDLMETCGQWLRDIIFKSFLYLLDRITFFSYTVAGLITRLGWHPDIWGRKASFVHLWNSSWGWRKALINCWRNAGPLWWHALSLSLSLSLFPFTHTSTR